MKVCIILPKGLPVPSVLGGAIETLMTDIIDKNELYKKLDITIASTYNEKALEVSNKYKNTNFIYININSFKYKIKALKVRLFNIFGHHMNTYNECVLDNIKHDKYDYILVEDGAFHSFITYLKYFKKEQMILHFHHVGPTIGDTDKTFGKFIGVSEYVVNEFKKSSNIDKCMVLKNGIDINKFKNNITLEEKEFIRSKYGFTMDDFVIVYCGRLIEIKGVLNLIDAVNNIPNDNIKLLLIGSGDGNYMKMINERLSSKVKLAGFINNLDVYKYYKTADIGVIPSICEDAAPLVTVEMMASGLPLIITKSGGAPEYVSEDTIIIPKDDNIINNLKNKILYLYNNKDLLKQMSDNGINISNSYTTDNFYNTLIKTLEK